MRKGDALIPASQLDEQSEYAWTKMMFSNANQFNSDGDRIGELCENDRDRDGIYEDNYNKDAVAPEDVKYWVDNCPSTQQLTPTGQLYTAGEVDYYNATETDPATPVGDACDVRKTFVLLRSFGSKSAGGQPLCITHQGMILGTPSGAMTDMVECNPLDVNQRFYMSPIDGSNVNNVTHYYFYSGEARNSSVSRMVNWQERRDNIWGAVCGGNWSNYDAHVRMFRGTTSTITGWSPGQESCNAAFDYGYEQRTRPNWQLELMAGSATDLDANKHPWQIKSAGGWGTDCLKYSGGFGIDTNQNDCGTGDAYRWAVWVGFGEEPWNGEW